MTRPRPRYQTVGDVRREVDAAFLAQELRTAGGAFYPRIGSLVFGIVDRNGRRAGDAYCPLPGGGWIADVYNSTTPEHDALALKVVKGAGELVIPYETSRAITEADREILLSIGANGSRYFSIINGTQDRLLIVHAKSWADPTNHTNRNHDGAAPINDALRLQSAEFFSQGQTLGPEGSAVVEAD